MGIANEVMKIPLTLLYFYILQENIKRTRKCSFCPRKCSFSYFRFGSFNFFSYLCSVKKNTWNASASINNRPQTPPVSGKPPLKPPRETAINPSWAQLPIRLAHNPNPPRSHPHVGADHLSQPLREEGSKRSVRTITNKMGKYGGQTQGSAPTRVEHASVTNWA